MIDSQSSLRCLCEPGVVYRVKQSLFGIGDCFKPWERAFAMSAAGLVKAVLPASDVLDAG